MNFVKRHSALISCTISLAIIIASYSFLIGAGDNGTIRIKTIAGDKRALNGTVVSGVLRDKYHGLEFTIDNGKVSKEFKSYDRFSDNNQNSSVGISNNIIMDGKQYYYNLESEVAPDAHKDISESHSEPEKGPDANVVAQPENYTEYVTRADKVKLFVNISIMGKNTENNIRYDTGVTIESKYKDFVFKETYQRGGSNTGAMLTELSSTVFPVRSDRSEAFTFINNKMYFTVLTDKVASGDNGIFRVDNWGNWPNWGNKLENGKVKRLATFNLDKYNTEVLSLKNVNGRLVLIMLVDGRLTFRAYNPETGDILDELKLDGDSWKDQTHSYQVFVDKDMVIITSNEKLHSIVSVKLDESFTLEQNVKALDMDGENSPNYYKHAAVVNGKLFIFCYLTKTSDNDMSFENLRPQHYIMYVYDKARPYGKLLFKGEIVSDADQDMEFDRQISNIRNGFTYENFKYRQFEDVQVKN
jgi:hypothetical protein